jgi:lysophospholipase L1-like esterase
MSKSAKPTQPKSPLSLGKRMLFGSILLAAPLVLLLACEGVLRLFGFGGNDPVFRKAGEVAGGSLMISDQAGAISYFFANRARPGYNDQYQFLHPKPKGTFRIFLVGESAAKGYPQPRQLASSAFLQKMLFDAWPDRTVEVINLGTTAVASFPVLGMMTEALEYEPDLIIVHTGHNEFFGAYGVSSVSRGGASVGRLKATRLIRSLALVQALSRWTTSPDAMKGKTLMEIMVAESYTAPDHPIRQAAANNLGANISEMVKRCQQRNVPVLVCTMPSNERDLHPVGEDRFDGVTTEAQQRCSALLAQAEALLATNPQAALTNLATAISLAPKNAHAHFLSGQAFHALSRPNEAHQAFDAARDLDSMPWRATSLQQTAIREAAAKSGGALCDMVAAFRAASPGGCIGWELMDDHVHPTMRGQALMAEAIVASLRRMSGGSAVSDAQFTRIRPWETYAAAFGDNPFDRYAVDHQMRVLFNVSFMKERNAAAYRRFNERASAFESTLSPGLKNIVREWQSEVPHAGGKRPITGMVAREFMREKRFDEALKLYEIAQRAVPEYTSWHMEYVYFALACREKLAGQLSDAERQTALAEIEQGKFLLQRGFSQTGLTERYIGRLHQLRGEFAEAIPFLNASRQKLGGFDLVAADQALFVSFLKTGQQKEARQLAENGVAKSGQYAPLYRQMLDVLDQKPAVQTPE